LNFREGMQHETNLVFVDVENVCDER